MCFTIVHLDFKYAFDSTFKAPLSFVLLTLNTKLPLKMLLTQSLVNEFIENILIKCFIRYLIVHTIKKKNSQFSINLKLEKQ